MNALPFLLPHIVSLCMIYGYMRGQTWASRVVVWVYLLAIVLDTVAGLDDRKPSGAETSRSLTWRLVIWFWPPIRIALIVCGLIVTAESLAPKESLSIALSTGIAVGMTGGMFTVPIAHELMHRQGRFDRALAQLLMTLSSYPHFCTEHVQGHHSRVGTVDDPATARLGESFYAFYPRTVFGGVRSAWALELERLRRLSVPPISFRNRLLRSFAALLLVYVTIGIVWGRFSIVFFAVQGVIGFSLLEVINYVEHYGLTRRLIAPGRYEPVSARHAWDSSHRVSNWLLLNVALHAEHHCNASRPFLALRSRDEAPQLPAGYFAMFTLALMPPLWRRAMDPRVRAEQERQSGDSCSSLEGGTAR